MSPAAATHAYSDQKKFVQNQKHGTLKIGVLKLKALKIR
jgi:hypothetical protein